MGSPISLVVIADIAMLLLENNISVYILLYVKYVDDIVIYSPLESLQQIHDFFMMKSNLQLKFDSLVRFYSTDLLDTTITVYSNKFVTKLVIF